MLVIYGIKNCDTMQKAFRWLDAHGAAYRFHDYKAEGIDAARLRTWCDRLGWEAVLNRAGTTFRKLPDADKQGLDAGKAIALMQAQPSGAMLSVRLPLDALLPRLPQALSLAAENAPGTCVVAGPHEAIAAFQQRLEGEGVACRALKTSHAFHSAMMDGALDPFEAVARGVPCAAPKIPLISNLTGRPFEAGEAPSAAYWRRQLREAVQFATGAQTFGQATGQVIECRTFTTPKDNQAPVRLNTNNFGDDTAVVRTSRFVCEHAQKIRLPQLPD